MSALHATPARLHVYRAAETHPVFIRTRMADDLEDLRRMNGGVTREDMRTLGWTDEQLTGHMREAITQAALAGDDRRRATGADDVPAKHIRRSRVRTGHAAPRLARTLRPSGVRGVLERSGATIACFACFAIAVASAIATKPAVPNVEHVPKISARLCVPAGVPSADRTTQMARLP